MNFLDGKTKEKIGFCYVLENILITSVFGRDILYNLEPVEDKAELLMEYENIERGIDASKNRDILSRVISILKRFKDIRNTFARCKNGKILDVVELYEIKSFVLLTFELNELCKTNQLNFKGIVLHDFSKVYKLLNPMNSKELNFYIYDNYSSKLKDIRNRKKDIEKKIYKEENMEKQKELFKKRANIVNEEREEELAIRKKLSFEILKFVDKLLESTFFIGKLDLIFAKAILAMNYHMCKPKISDEFKIKIETGVNPMVEQQVKKIGGRFYPISLEVSKGSCVITGANMGGKTVALSIVALNYFMASMGFYAFAQCFEFIPLDFMCFLSEDTESLQKGLSTFGGEVLKLKEILNRLEEGRGIIIIDEFARGTNPMEGSNLTKALVKYLNKLDSISVIATHYDRACLFSKAHYQVRGLKNVDFQLLKELRSNEVDYLNLINSYMDYTLEKVDKDTLIPRDAVNICRFIGIKKEIIELAEEFYNKNEGEEGESGE